MIEIKIGGRPLDTLSYKIARACVNEGKDEYEQIDAALQACEHAIMAGCEVNPKDLWLFCTALKILANSLEEGMDSHQRAGYKKLQRKIGVTTIIERKTEGDDDAT